MWLGDLPVAVLKQAGTTKQGSLQVQVYDVYADHLATPRVITRATDQAIVWRWDGAEPFGATGPDENPKGLGVFRFDQRFPGQVFDVETGPMQNWHREYRVPVGRYVQSDPIGLAGGINTYSYVKNNPLGHVDPNGLMGFGGGGSAGSNRKPTTVDPASPYFGGEGHFLVGGGLTSVTCTDECGKRQTFRYWKVCVGAAVGISGGGGLVTNMSGKNCKAETYKGWFFENALAWGYGGTGVDVGYNGDGPLGLPGSLSGVDEVSAGVGLGVSFKSSWCYYIPLN